MIASAINLRLEQASPDLVQIGGNGKGLLQEECSGVLESRGMQVHNHREKFRQRLQAFNRCRILCSAHPGFLQLHSESEFDGQ